VRRSIRSTVAPAQKPLLSGQWNSGAMRGEASPHECPAESGTLARWEVNLTQQWATLYRSGIAWSHVLEGSLCSTRGPRSRCTAIGARLPEAGSESEQDAATSLRTQAAREPEGSSGR
jgi:hypothetical protein